MHMYTFFGKHNKSVFIYHINQIFSVFLSLSDAAEFLTKSILFCSLSEFPNFCYSVNFNVSNWENMLFFTHHDRDIIFMGWKIKTEGNCSENISRLFKDWNAFMVMVNWKCELNWSGLDNEF